jgi:Na+/H+-translocating membrane pyrophosphatase
LHSFFTCISQGDTVGDPFKDTSGPALNIVMKLMAVLSLGEHCDPNKEF